MILIVESGSTKADWVLVDKGNLHSRFTTEGLNPFTNADYDKIIAKTVADNLSDYDISHIWFYGAGIVGEKEEKNVASAFNDMSNGRSTQVVIEVKDDLIAAARATCDTDEGIVCILGTGSNIGHFDGTQIIAKVASGGYLLGSEGSGMALGREVLKMYIRDQLSPASIKFLESEYQISKENIFDKVYTQHIINRYVASFAKAITGLEPHEKLTITSKVFNEFLEERILKLEASKKLPLNFVGSVADSFSKEIEDMLKKNNLSLGKIVDKPIHNLVEYHIKHN